MTPAPKLLEHVDSVSRGEGIQLKTISMVLVLVLVVAMVISWSLPRYREYREQRLSPEVKAAVLAVTHQNANLSDTDVSEYLRAAKLASRTKRDTEIVRLLDKWISLTAAYTHDSREAAKWSEDARQERSLAGTMVRHAVTPTDRSMAESVSRDANESAEKEKNLMDAAFREEEEAQRLIRQLMAAPELQPSQ